MNLVRCRCGRFAAYIGDRGWWCKLCDRSVKHPLEDEAVVHGDGSGVALPPVSDPSEIRTAAGIDWTVKRGIGSVLVRPYRDDDTECPNCEYPGGGLVVTWIRDEDGAEMNGCNRCGWRWPHMSAESGSQPR